MTFEEFKKRLQEKGFASSEKQTDKLVRLFIDELDEIRKTGGKIRIPKFGTFTSVKKPARQNVLIGGFTRNIPARQRFVFKPLKATNGVDEAVFDHARNETAA